MHLTILFIIVVNTTLCLAAALIPPPEVGLKSNFNYYLHDNGSIIHDLLATIDIKEDLVLSNAAGWTIQLNGYSPPTDSDTWVFQQFSIGLEPPAGTSLVASICQWAFSSALSGPSALSLKLMDFVSFVELSQAQTIPAGSQLSIRLLGDPSGTIFAGNFSATIGGKTTLQTLDMRQETLIGGSTPSAANFAPITAFTLNIVGWGGCSVSTFSGGSGTITYSSNVSRFEGLNVEPKNLGLAQDITCETSNVGYGQISVGLRSKVTQTFSINT
jgi:hypothetical protein